MGAGHPRGHRPVMCALLTKIYALRAANGFSQILSTKVVNRHCTSTIVENFCKFHDFSWKRFLDNIRFSMSNQIENAHCYISSEQLFTGCHFLKNNHSSVSIHACYLKKKKKKNNLCIQKGCFGTLCALLNLNILYTHSGSLSKQCVIKQYCFKICSCFHHALNSVYNQNKCIS